MRMRRMARGKKALDKNCGCEGRSGLISYSRIQRWTDRTMLSHALIVGVRVVAEREASDK